MIHIGKHNLLKPLRNTRVGVFLGDGEGTEVLLPNKYVPEGFDFEKKIKVFCYLDHEERPIATTLEPSVERDSFAYLKVAQVNAFGAFLDWGLEKQLFVPFKEQLVKMEEGKSYLVFCYLDEKSFRIMASARLNKFLSNKEIGLSEGDEVKLTFWRKTSLGWEVIINQGNQGLIFFDSIFKSIEVGDTSTGYIKKIREDSKIDVTLQPVGVKMLEPTADLIFEKLQSHGGFLELNDKSSPEEIKGTFGISKKAFKKGLGMLYKARKVKFVEGGISIV